MDQVTQQNATMVEQSTAATQSLAQETSQLSELICRFQLSPAERDGALRRELQKVAPHAFRQPAKAAPAAKAKAPVARAARPAKVAGGGSVDAGGGWTEF